MSRVRNVLIGAVTGIALLFTVEACKDDKPTEAGPVNISDPAAFEAAMKRHFLPIVAGVADGLERVIAAISGGPADGVIVTPTANGADATVSVDFNGDGTREGSIDGSFVGVVTVGAQLSITSIQASEPSLSGGGVMSVVETQPGVVLLDGMAGGGSADPPGSGNAADVSVSSGTVTLDVMTGVASGFLDLFVSGEGNSLSATATFEPDGQGGFRVRFSGPGFEFTVP